MSKKMNSKNIVNNENKKIKDSLIKLSKAQLKSKELRAKIFKLAAVGNINILLVGDVGSGTTVMKSMIDSYPRNKRPITVEDLEELNVTNHPNQLAT